MNRLEVLIARLAALAGPDREVDRAIAELKGWWKPEHAEKCLPFTGSIDAAVALVEGWHWQVEIFNLDEIPRAQLAQPTMNKYGPAIGIRAQAKGATPAIALCSAWVQAIAAERAKVPA